jgi:NADPH-dependent 2,4-dienoyl-CoA reductase/sulfur reductase-like enzyme
MGTRRAVLRHLGLTAGALALSRAGAVAARAPGRHGRVVVIGGGFGGATVSRYLRRLAPGIAVDLVEPKATYHTCPRSNEILGGWGELPMLARQYAALSGHDGITVHRSSARDFDPDRRIVELASGKTLRYDRLVVAPGVRLRWNAIPGYDRAAATRMPHAWRAGAQTLLLRDQLRAMADGGVVVISVPARPFRCPPGPYERASVIAAFLEQHKPRSKILILDANDSFTKQALFEEAWKSVYPGMIEWVPITSDGAVTRVDPASLTLHTELDSHRAAVANVIPPQCAARIAERFGLTDATGWCPILPANFESSRVPGVHVIGDACIADPMPKSASAANSQAKACAVSIAAALTGEAPPAASLHNTCYSLAAQQYGISITMIYRVQDGHIVPVEGAGGVSPLGASRATRAAEAQYARGWFASITADGFGY